MKDLYSWDLSKNKEERDDWGFDDEDEDAEEKIPLTPSQFVETSILMPNPHTRALEEFSFADRGYLQTVYDCQAPRILMMCGRQVEKSTTLANKMLSYSCLIPHFKTLYVSPSSTQTKEFSKTRLKEMLETCPVLRTWFPPNLTDNILEKKAINRSQLTLRYAFLNADRCLVGDTRVQLSDGDLVPVRDLVGTTPSVITCGEWGRTSIREAIKVWSTGFKDVVKLDTTGPLPLRLTSDHEVKTQHGWKQAVELKPGDWIPAPACYNSFSTVENGVTWEMGFILGALISEGNCTSKASVRFTNTDENYLDLFEECCGVESVSYGKRILKSNPNKPAWTINLYSDKKGPGLSGGKKRVWEIGQLGKLSYDKRIPHAIRTGSFDAKVGFLLALFWGDGWCAPDRGIPRAGYCTASKLLAEDLALMLWSMGIRCSVRVKPPKDSTHEKYALDFSTMATEKLVSMLGEFREGTNIHVERSPKDINDRIPFTYEQLRKYLQETYGISTHAAWRDYKIQLRAGNRKDSIGRRVLQEIADKLADPFLQDLAREENQWVEVKSVVPDGHEEVFDMTVPGTENFIANGLMVHNCRGLSADLIALDEFQDLLLDNIPVIEEAASHSAFRWFIYSGTPKSLDNPIQHYWENYSTKNEWVVPCDRHGFRNDPSTWHWNILGEANIGIHSLICDKCGEEIFPQHPHAQWVKTGNPSENFDTYEGFRIPQLMVPWIPWKNILTKYNQYPRPKFFNEVLGMSFDSGQRPLTQQDMMDNCDPKLEMSADALQLFIKNHGNHRLYAGIDWGADSNNSYTVFTVAAYIDGKFTILFMHRFSGPEAEPKEQIEKLKRLITSLKIHRVGVDYGGGFWPNDELLRTFGSQKIIRYQYSSPKTILSFDSDKGRYMAHRSEVMSVVFNGIKRRSVFRFPNWQDFQSPFGADFLAVFSEYNERRRMTEFKKSPNTTDDSLHSLVFCFLASLIDHPRIDLIIPNAKVDKELYDL